LAVDAAGSLYIADQGNNVIRKVTTDGIISTFAGTGQEGFSGDGGAAVTAGLAGPAGVAVDDAGNVLIADTGNAVVRRVDASGIITTIAGQPGKPGSSGDGGVAAGALLSGVCRLLPVGRSLLVADTGNHRIRKIDERGRITRFAGNGESITSGDGGPAVAAGVPVPVGMAVDDDGNVFVAQSDYRGDNARIRKIDPAGTITTYAGTGRNGFDGDGGLAILARFSDPTDVVFDSDGRLLISDYFNHRIRMVDDAGYVRTIVGVGHAGFGGNGGLADAAHINRPLGLAFNRAGDLFIADAENHRVRKVTAPICAPSARPVWDRRAGALDPDAAFEALLAVLDSEAKERGASGSPN
jgi:DNA-binding beta-propeller fold protein YncE